MDIKELEEVDYDILENIKVSFRELWKKKWIIILTTILGGLCALVYIGIVGRSTYYTARASVFSAAYGSYEESATGVSAMNAYADIIGSSIVCERAAESLSEYGITSDKLKEMVSAGQIYVAGASTSSREYGYKLQIYASSRSSERAIPIANAMANAFTAELNAFLGQNIIQVMDEASSYSVSEKINVKMYIAIFSAVGLVLSSGIIFVCTFFSPWVRSVEQCEMKEENILGIIPFSKE
ncbi:Capsular polysaccharide biosynthesis protein [Acetitomaculum ruminis DSM 5522]|uniref:Capsular polysaccharide biosynthesis protein n=1 Tax=Acetitomaculum ruminis DSM 5522 TaxID=1120918 RepID=A0A1I0Z3Z9_9FIRM|nr:Wzz/FepE/Etk N-terminal domain-containing protein [Acetitomaculum ruminis]SFB18993.1 Capsular polysaccharide biosynthesis protein [Acetitomaculum ruminis DSM 5522]